MKIEITEIETENECKVAELVKSTVAHFKLNSLTMGIE